MQQLTNKELNQTYGGISINGTLINAFMKGINTFLDLGRSLGTAIVRAIYGGYCPV